MSRVVVGLPSGPRPTRLHSRPRNEPDRHDRAPPPPPPPPPRQILSQKSVTFQPKERGVPPTPRRSQTPSITSSRSSNDSESSISSRSIFDHIRSGTGYASSITSFEDDDKMRDGPQKAQSLRRRVDTGGQGNYSEPEGTASNSMGSTLWNRVAVAASGLTVNVSKAWASNVATMSGEETPPGQESRLTRAMKSYHLEKARDRSDLPAWLFEEHERMPRHHLSESPKVAPIERAAARGKGLREIYESAASTAIITSRRSEQSARYMDGDTHPSKATDRLKAIRDAKRTALQPQSTNIHQSVKSDTVGARGNEDADGRGMSGGRVGLPSGPGPRSRRYK